MTCVVGIADKGKVWMGADSAAISGYDDICTSVKKVFKKNGFIIGYTTSFRMGQILENHIDYEMLEEKSKEYNNDLNFLIVEFIQYAREALKIHGYTNIDSNTETGGQFMLGWNGKLYLIHNDFQVLPLGNDEHITMHAIGCGADYALGALNAAYNFVLLSDNRLRKTYGDPEILIGMALSVSSSYSCGVHEPFYTLSIGEDNENS